MTFTRRHKAYLYDALDLNKEALDFLWAISNRPLKGRHAELKILRSSCFQSANAINQLLTNTSAESEAYMLMRALLERLINYHYLCVAEDAEVDKYFLHAYYRAYHSTSKQLSGGGHSISIAMSDIDRQELKSNSDVKEALKIFSETNPRMQWTNKKFSERVAIVAEKGQINEGILLLSSLLTYSDASEALHGSFYGTMFLTGAFTPTSSKFTKNSKEYVMRSMAMKLTVPLVLLSGLLIATAKIIAIDHGYSSYTNRAVKLEEKAIAVLESTQTIS